MLFQFVHILDSGTCKTCSFSLCFLNLMCSSLRLSIASNLERKGWFKCSPPTHLTLLFVFSVSPAPIHTNKHPAIQMMMSFRQDKLLCVGHLGAGKECMMNRQVCKVPLNVCSHNYHPVILFRSMGIKWLDLLSTQENTPLSLFWSILCYFTDRDYKRQIVFYILLC